MRIEILVDGSDEPQIYPINKPKLVLGSGETCDVVISSGNISRKHLVIVAEGDAYYVVDQGSTNGSYINEERLVPGRRTEFTSFFPVRLGDNVLITLLSDEEATTEDTGPLIPVPKEEPAQSRGAGETTKMISLADLKKAKTADLQVKREQVVKKAATAKGKKPLPKKTKRTEENQKFKTMLFLTVLFVGAIGYYNVTKVKEEQPEGVARMGEQGVPSEVPKKKAEPVAVVEPPKELVPENELLPKQRYPELLGDLKCITDIEKYFCEKVPGASGKYGAVQIGTTIHIMIDGDAYIKEARTLVEHPKPDANGQYPPEIYEPYKKVAMETALAIFWLKGFPSDIDWEKIKDLKISVGIFEVWEGQTYIQVVGTIYPHRLKDYKQKVEMRFIENVKQVGAPALDFTKDFYRAY